MNVDSRIRTNPREEYYSVISDFLWKQKRTKLHSEMFFQPLYASVTRPFTYPLVGVGKSTTCIFCYFCNMFGPSKEKSQILYESHIFYDFIINNFQLGLTSRPFLFIIMILNNKVLFPWQVIKRVLKKKKNPIMSFLKYPLMKAKVSRWDFS